MLGTDSTIPERKRKGETGRGKSYLGGRGSRNFKDTSSGGKWEGKRSNKKVCRRAFLKFCLRAPFSLGESRRKREGGRGGGGGGGLCGCPVCRSAPSFSFSFSILGISPPPFLTFSSSSSSCSFLVSEIEFLPPGAIKRISLFPFLSPPLGRWGREKEVPKVERGENKGRRL